MIIRVAAVEDDEVLRTRYSDLIRSAPDMDLLWTAANLAQGRKGLAGIVPDVLLVDLGLPDGSGLELIRDVTRQGFDCETMVVSVFGDEVNVVAAIKAGASGYLLKDAIAESFLRTIREVRAGGSPISPSIARIVLDLALARVPPVPPVARAGRVPDAEAASTGTLGERELQILGLVSKGYGFGEIARLLGISNSTVKTHIYRIYRKLAVHSRGEAVFEAKKLGLLDF